MRIHDYYIIKRAEDRNFDYYAKLGKEKWYDPTFGNNPADFKDTSDFWRDRIEGYINDRKEYEDKLNQVNKAIENATSDSVNDNYNEILNRANKQNDFIKKFKPTYSLANLDGVDTVTLEDTYKSLPKFDRRFLVPSLHRGGAVVKRRDDGYFNPYDKVMMETGKEPSPTSIHNASSGLLAAGFADKDAADTYNNLYDRVQFYNDNKLYDKKIRQIDPNADTKLSILNDNVKKVRDAYVQNKRILGSATGAGIGGTAGYLGSNALSKYMGLKGGGKENDFLHKRLGIDPNSKYRKYGDITLRTLGTLGGAALGGYGGYNLGDYYGNYRTKDAPIY